MQMNLLGVNPISALFWAAVINGFVAPPLLVIIMLAANQKKIMGKWVNGIVTNIIGWATAAVMAAAAIALVLKWGKARRATPSVNFMPAFRWNRGPAPEITRKSRVPPSNHYPSGYLALALGNI